MLKTFFKDHVLDFAAYISITFLLIVYYRLEIGKPIPIIYPILLVIFVAIVITFLKGIHYYRFHKAIQSGNYKYFLMKGASGQAMECIRVIEEIHKYYNLELSKQLDQKKSTYAFIAQLAHDMKIPISVINLLLEDDDNRQPSKEQLLHQIKSESNKLLDKLSQMLCYLRLGQFETDYIIEQADLITEVRNAINNKKSYFIMNQIYPRLHFSQEPIPVLTDKKWNAMLLDQIISNAIKYSALKERENYIQFDITILNNYAELTITDYGIGIPEYDLARIYEPFFTGKNGRKVQNSSGIGLYLCKIISEKLGHSLSVTSVEGEGTTIKLRYLSKM